MTATIFNLHLPCWKRRPCQKTHQHPRPERGTRQQQWSRVVVAGGATRLRWLVEARVVVAGGSRGRRNLQRRNGSCAREEEGVLFLSPNQTLWPRFHAAPEAYHPSLAPASP
ncbi:hypothetical protein DEO72_LG1g3098 [Vigna unguiculata]|uniref:Uncharacterized protein n=1 Tax=Vigna unguiculata TaxID=3917 RepID=A0A4D6KMZ2_VIGUN|nr:hypothetical protein DEO72_LG1g3098 [Vigna unguiculata]